VDPARAVIVETPHVEVVVRGTRFDVEVEPASASSGTITNVSVARGTVAILRHGALVASLSAGERWSSASRTLAPLPTGVGDSVASAPPKPALSTRKPAVPGEVAPPEVSGTLAEENRLFQEALEARGRGDHARAVDSFGRLLGRYPRSPLAEEAQAERFRGLRRMGQTARAAAEARRYLAQYPAGFAAAEARELALEPTMGPGKD
jgi:ferric-dicitrate binding protein FerR (iron transport regulator)